DGGAARGCPARQSGSALRQADRGGAPGRGPHRLLPGRLVLGDQPARRRLARGDEAGDLAQLPGRQQGRPGRAFARAQCPGRSGAQDRSRSPARQVLRRGMCVAIGDDHGAPARHTTRRDIDMSAHAKESYAEFHRRSLEDRDAFWAEQAQLVDWQRPFDVVCDATRPPFTRWFVGGTTNLCHNAVDRHLAARAAQPALIHVSTETGSERVYSFAELHAEVQRMAAMLLSLGVAKGDRVLLYLPMVPEAAFAMLACA